MLIYVHMIPGRLRHDPEGAKQKYKGQGEDELHVPPVRDTVGNNSCHQAPEAKVVVRRGPQDSLHFAVRVLHHPAVHHRAVTEGHEGTEKHP